VTVKLTLTLPLLLVVLAFAACGDDPAPTAPAVEVPSWAKVAPEQIAEARKHGVPVAFENDLGMRFVLIPAGTFLRGTPSDEVRWSWETPQHEVTISRPFYMSIYEVTNEQYRAFKPDHDSGDDADFEEATEADDLNGDRQPAVGIPDVDAMAFSRWLGMREGGRTYVLPTEAEWHYACRAGSRTTFAWGDDPADAAKYANVFDGRRRDRLDERNTMASPILSAQVEDDGFAVTAPVGSYLPNAWGLFDMHGNASEWCRDWASKLTAEAVTDPQGPEAGEHRMIAGGSFADEMYFQRASSRSSLTGGPESGWFKIGFRLVSPLPEPGEGTR
jgi:sulfatase modifying factor 1